jgi:hypothetical protein
LCLPFTSDPSDDSIIAVEAILVQVRLPPFSGSGSIGDAGNGIVSGGPLSIRFGQGNRSFLGRLTEMSASYSPFIAEGSSGESGGD